MTSTTKNPTDHEVHVAHAVEGAKHYDPPCECSTCGPVRGGSAGGRQAPTFAFVTVGNKWYDFATKVQHPSFGTIATRTRSGVMLVQTRDEHEAAVRDARLTARTSGGYRRGDAIRAAAKRAAEKMAASCAWADCELCHG